MAPIGSTIRADEGFSLTELLVVMLIIAVLLVIAVASYVPASAAAHAAACRHNQRVLERGAVVLESSADEPPPAHLADLAPYVTDFTEVSRCPLDGTALTLDPATLVVTCPNHP
ncbi:MAG: prepilin-type N-terminal cleavage/methylation domain-containing protein [Coriobacteriia bacterium]